MSDRPCPRGCGHGILTHTAKQGCRGEGCDCMYPITAKALIIRDPWHIRIRDWLYWHIVQPIRCRTGKHYFKFGPRSCIACGAPLPPTHSS